MSYRTDKLGDGRTDWRTDAGNNNTRRPILVSGKKHTLTRCWYIWMRLPLNLYTICLNMVAFSTAEFMWLNSCRRDLAWVDGTSKVSSVAGSTRDVTNSSCLMVCIPNRCHQCTLYAVYLPHLYPHIPIYIYIAIIIYIYIYIYITLTIDDYDQIYNTYPYLITISNSCIYICIYTSTPIHIHFYPYYSLVITCDSWWFVRYFPAFYQ